ncbi:MAG: AmmeMemoRadiSam system protein B [Calditrichaceae bacterium]
MEKSNKIRQPAVAGLFYSKQKSTLEREVAVYLENSPAVKDVNQIYGLVAPHAGYMYSGGVAARAYRQLVDREFDVVVVIAPSHRTYFEEVSVYNGYGYSTPLGDIPVDRKLASEIAEMHSSIIYSDIGHEIDEHALEVQLPFLQQVLGEFKLVPVVMGNQDMGNVKLLAEALSKVLQGKKALVVASSDLSHYHHYDRAAMIDNVVVDNINEFDAEKLNENLLRNSCEMCGGGPVMATMMICRNLGAKSSKVLIYRNSGDVTGQKSEVVGYLSAIFYS